MNKFIKTSICLLIAVFLFVIYMATIAPFIGFLLLMLFDNSVIRAIFDWLISLTLFVGFFILASKWLKI